MPVPPLLLRRITSGPPLSIDAYRFGKCEPISVQLDIFALFFLFSPFFWWFACAGLSQPVFVAGSNPYAALAGAPSKVQSTQREQPAPKKNLAKAKDASKLHQEPAKARNTPADPKRGAGNNSAKPGRPEREADRKGRTFPKKSGTGRGTEPKRDGKEWGQNKRVEDGVREVRTGGKERGGERGERRERRDRKPREPRGEREREEKPELTPEEEAARVAAREAEERQMTLEEWQAKQAGGPVAEVEFKEARRVEADDLQGLKKQVREEPTVEWAGAGAGRKGGRRKEQRKREVIVPGSAPKRAGKREDEATGSNNNNSNNGGGRGKQAAPNLNLEDAASFPSLGGK